MSDALPYDRTIPPAPVTGASSAIPPTADDVADSAAMARLTAAVDEVGVPKVIGRYHVIEKIGEGGMGIVVKAEQRAPVRRIVAVKVVKLGMDSKSVLGRFQGEQQALAVMDHPNIAKVLDAGLTDSGRAYFVMEYVPGESITKYCDRQQLGIRQRIELFRHVCLAVQHAHTKGIIHRDLKPDNVLVSVREGEASVKVIDFGVAKALHGRLGEETYFTEHGQIIGTPEYMSPEQAEMNHLDIDTRTDIYGLGVMLYELLTGCRPFDTKTLRAATYQEIQRIIREDAPPRPSTRLTRLGADVSAAIAQNRRMRRDQLKSQLQRELEWIPLKALRKDRTERYQTAAAMEQDLSNYLQGRPLLAGPESSLYRARKLLSRNKSPLVTALVLVVAITAGLLTIRSMVARQQKATEAAGLVKRLIDADTGQVPKIVAELDEYRQWADPLLRQENEKAQPASRQKLNTSLALVPVDGGQTDFLYGRLLAAEPKEEVPVIRDALFPRKAALVDKLWSVVETSGKSHESMRLRAAAALATFDPAGDKWNGCSPLVVNDLVRENPIFLGHWSETFRPVKTHLLVALGDVYRDRQPDRSAERNLATSLLADYAADDPQILANLLMDADERQFRDIYPTFAQQAKGGLPLLIVEIEKLAPADKKKPPNESDDPREKLAKRQANAAVALLKMNQPAKIWPLLAHSPDPRVRSYLIDRFGALQADARTLIARLEEEPGLRGDQEPELSIRRALILSLGEVAKSDLSPDERTQLLVRLRDLYCTAADPGLHAATEWLLRSWGQGQWLSDVNEKWAKDQEKGVQRLATIIPAIPNKTAKPPSQWYVNSQRQTMVVIPGPVDFMMGSPEIEAKRADNERQHKKHIGRTFAISETAVTLEQCRRFDGDKSQLLPVYHRSIDSPAVFKSWYEAAAYCNWLSEQEKIPPDQWCYESEGEQVTKMKPGYLSLTGYRLPTEAEMEYAIRAGAITSRFYGETEELMEKYAYYNKNSEEKACPVGSKKPNDLGLFDALGNVWCWCQDAYPSSATHIDEDVEDKEGELNIIASQKRQMRGGSNRNYAFNLRCAFRGADLPGGQNANDGFRVARTLQPARAN